MAAEKTVELPFVECECAVGKLEKSVFNILFVAGGVEFRKDLSQHGAAFVGGPHEATELSAEHLGVLVDFALLCHGFGLHLAPAEDGKGATRGDERGTRTLGLSSVGASVGAV